MVPVVISDMEAPTDVRSRARRALKAEVAQVAVDLFLANGFDATTVDQIAQAAGMSRATFFRYFRTKEDVVLDQAADFGAHIRDALVDRPDGEPLWTALRRCLDPVVAAHKLHWDMAVRMTQMMNRTPSIRARHHEGTIAWQAALLPEVTRRLHEGSGAGARTGTGTTDPRPGALVASALSCLDAAVDAWADDPADTDLAELLDAAMGAVGATPSGLPSTRRDPSPGPA